MPGSSRESRAEPPTAHVTVGDAAFGNQIQVGTTGSRQDQIIHLSENPQVRAFLLAYRQVLDQLSADRRADASSSLAMAEAELRSARPDQGRLREALASLRSIAESVAGNAAFSVLVELGRHLL